MSSRDINDLAQELKQIWTAVLAAAPALLPVGDKCITVGTYRSLAEQAAAYAIGRTVKGIIITNAKPGSSKHNVIDKLGKPASRAVDFGIIRYGKYIGNGSDASYRIIGELAESLGLVWAGRWRGSLKETAHTELP